MIVKKNITYRSLHDDFAYSKGAKALMFIKTEHEIKMGLCMASTKVNHDIENNEKFN